MNVSFVLDNIDNLDNTEFTKYTLTCLNKCEIYIANDHDMMAFGISGLYICIHTCIYKSK